MKFCTEVDAWSRSLSQVYGLPGLLLNCQRGLQAIERRHRGHNGCIRCGRSQFLRLSSVCLDRDLQHWPPFAGEPRWDYGIGLEDTNGNLEQVVWVEVHSASTSNVKEVLRKLEWLKGLLRRHSGWLNYRHRYRWAVPPGGKVNIPRHTRQAKELRMSGIEWPKEVVDICE